MGLLGSVFIYHRGGGLSQRQLGTLQWHRPRHTPVSIVHSHSTAGKGGRETPVAGQQTDSTRAQTRARQVSSSQRGCGTRGAAVGCGCCAMRVWASQGCTQVERGAMWQRGWGAERGWVERRWVGSVGRVGLVRAGRAGEELRRCLRCSGAGARLAHSSGVSPCRGGAAALAPGPRGWRTGSGRWRRGGRAVGCRRGAGEARR